MFALRTLGKYKEWVYESTGHPRWGTRVCTYRTRADAARDLKANFVDPKAYEIRKYR